MPKFDIAGPLAVGEGVFLCILLPDGIQLQLDQAAVCIKSARLKVPGTVDQISLNGHLATIRLWGWFYGYSQQPVYADVIELGEYTQLFDVGFLAPSFKF